MTPAQIETMKQAGKIAALAMQKTLKAVKPGITTLSLDEIAENSIIEQGATPGFKKVENYNYTTCININEGIVHGIPNDYEIKKGDILSIDLGVFYKGFYSDLAHTVEVGTSNETAFLDVGKKALSLAIEACVAGDKLGEVSNIIQKTIEKAGFTVSRDLVGHGIGKDLHEPPQIPCYGKKADGPVLQEGTALAIEVIYQKGKPELFLKDDMWTLETEDKSLSALFEHTVVVTKKDPEVLTEFKTLLI